MSFLNRYKKFCSLILQSPAFTAEEQGIIINFLSHGKAKEIKRLETSYHKEQELKLWIELKAVLSRKLDEDAKIEALLDICNILIEDVKALPEEKSPIAVNEESDIAYAAPPKKAPSYKAPSYAPEFLGHNKRLTAEELARFKADRIWYKGLDFVDHESFAYVNAETAFSERFLRKSLDYVEQSPFAHLEPGKVFPKRKMTYAYACLSHLGLNPHLDHDQKQALALSFLKNITASWPEEAVTSLTNAIEENSSKPCFAYLPNLSTLLNTKPEPLPEVKIAVKKTKPSPLSKESATALKQAKSLAVFGIRQSLFAEAETYYDAKELFSLFKNIGNNPLLEGAAKAIVAEELFMIILNRVGYDSGVSLSTVKTLLDTLKTHQKNADLSYLRSSWWTRAPLPKFEKMLKAKEASLPKEVAPPAPVTPFYKERRDYSMSDASSTTASHRDSTASSVSLAAAAETATSNLAKAEAATQGHGNAFGVLSLLSSAVNATAQMVWNLGNCFSFFGSSKPAVPITANHKPK